MDKAQLEATAKAIVADGKGILAADESTGTIKKRFDTIDVSSSFEKRRTYRQMLFTAPGANEFIGGVIMFDETLRQVADDETPFPKLLANQGTIPGIKVDAGAKPLAGHEGETITEGLDGLRERLEEYYNLGARFAKWRAVIDIQGADIPSDYAIKSNADALARYAALCQEANIVPIVEPEVLMDGDHDMDRCDEVTTQVLETVFAELKRADVHLPGILLKPNMIVPGKKSDKLVSVEEVAARTVDCLQRCVPAEVPGIVFLSGGQTEIQATAHLDAMNKLGLLPWALTYSYGRALQASALEAWRGEDSNIEAAQQAYVLRAKCNTAAAKGKYSSDMEAA